MSFTSKQKEIVARKLGYEGPMQGFDEYLRSSPALEMRYNTLSDKYMARGGMVKKYETGGAVTTSPPNLVIPADLSTRSVQEKAAFYNAKRAEGFTDAQLRAAVAPQRDIDWTTLTTIAASLNTGTTGGATGSTTGTATGTATGSTAGSTTGTTTGSTTGTATGTATGGTTTDITSGVSYTNIGGVPVAGTPSTTKAELITESANQLISGTGAAGTPLTKTIAKQAGPAVLATAPTVAPVSTYTAVKAAPSVAEIIEPIQAAQGVVRPETQVTAATTEPTATGVKDLTAAQLGQYQTVKEPTEARKLTEGELLAETSSVDQAKVEALLEATKRETAQGTVTEEMTVQGQLNKLMANFDAGNPPPWAAASLRSVTATLAARGLGVSSLAGQALIQTALESALPIASADAQAYQAVAAQNLSNRQQTAILAAQQRAAFLGQSFDQTFQTRVINAAKVADIANMNFTAKQQIALENARLAQTVDLANLSNSQAMVMATAAQIASLETANLNNRQQASVVNAQTFLAMDLKNLDNLQQTTLFKAQQKTQALMSDASMENAALQFNASSTNQRNQFEASLTAQVSQFNAAQQNAIATFNADQENSVAKFNAEQENARAEFDAKQRLIIDQSNAQWRRDISTTNTAATNAANYLNAQNAQAMTIAQYNNATLLYRDQVNNAFNSAENDMDRMTRLAEATIRAESAKTAEQDTFLGNLFKAAGNLVTEVFKK